MQSLPISLVDLQLADLMAFHALLRSNSSITPLGYREAEGTEKLLELEVDFPEEPVNAGFPDSIDTVDYSGRGASALAYTNPKDYTLRRVLVFDSEDRLVRIYEDFMYVNNKKDFPITSFRATSLLTGSHTVLT